MDHGLRVCNRFEPPLRIAVIYGSEDRGLEEYLPFDVKMQGEHHKIYLIPIIQEGDFRFLHFARNIF